MIRTKVLKAITKQYHSRISSEFIFNKKKYNYNLQDYNSCWENERTIEIPIIQSFVDNNKSVLEIGNVLKNYKKNNHLVVDKFEKCDAVINEDAENFNTKQKFDLIVSVSTFEHIGNNEELKPNPKNNDNDPTKLARVIKNLKNQLKPGGKIIATIPIGLNKNLEKDIENKKYEIIGFLKRKNRLNDWVQINSFQEIKNLEWGTPFPCANGLAIIKISS